MLVQNLGSDSEAFKTFVQYTCQSVDFDMLFELEVPFLFFTASEVLWSEKLMESCSGPLPCTAKDANNWRYQFFL